MSSESTRAGDRRTQTGRGKIQDSLAGKEKLKEPKKITVIKMVGLYEIMGVKLLKIVKHYRISRTFHSIF